MSPPSTSKEAAATWSASVAAERVGFAAGDVTAKGSEGERTLRDAECGASSAVRDGSSAVGAGA